jgi:hypothetical protein
MAMRLSRKRSETSTSQTSALNQYARPFVVQRQTQEEGVQAAPERGVSLLNNRYQVSATPKYQPGWIARAQAASQPKGLGVQAKVTIGQPNDKYEQEADRVAEQVMGMPDAKPTVQREALPGEEEEELQTKSLGGPIQREVMPEEEEIQAKPLSATITPLVQREVMPEEEEEIHAKCEKCDEEPIQRSAEGSAQAQPDLESRLMASKGSGSPLSADVRSFMEPRFGADFSGVRVHTGSEAVQMNRDVGAQAFAYGQDVYFGAGHGPGKDALTAHELTHVVQQTNTSQKKQISMQSMAQRKFIAGGARVNKQPHSAGELISRFAGSSEPYEVVAFGNALNLQAETHAEFNGSWRIANRRETAGKDCPNCGPPDCINSSGNLVNTFTVITRVELPEISDDLTPCQKSRVQQAINTKLKPHEQQHVRAFQTFRGTTQKAFSFENICRDDLKSKLQEMHDSERQSRQAVTQAKSDALDPFSIDVDLDCKDE